jgi:hypothetical protein
VPKEQVGAGLAAGAMLHVNATSEESNPFFGFTVIVETDDCPGVTEEGEGTDAESTKSAETAATLDVLALTLLLPL